MTTTIEDLQKMSDKELVKLATVLSRRFWNSSVVYKVGTEDDLIQLLCEQLFLYKTGKKVLHGKLFSACCSYVQEQAKSHWMTNFAQDYQHEDDIEDNENDIIDYAKEEVVEEGWESHSIEELELSAIDRLLLEYSPSHDKSQCATTKTLKEFYGCTDRSIRQNREKLFERLRKKFGVSIDLFKNGTDPKIVHSKNKVDDSKFINLNWTTIYSNNCVNNI